MEFKCLLCLLMLCSACDPSANEKKLDSQKETVTASNEMANTQIIKIKGFDKNGEPEIRTQPDGSLQIMFNFMPPSNGTEDGVDDPIFDHFDQELAKILEVEVIWEDREFFRIPKPKANTAAQAKAYLEGFWEQRMKK